MTFISDEIVSLIKQIYQINLISRILELLESCFLDLFSKWKKKLYKNNYFFLFLHEVNLPVKNVSIIFFSLKIIAESKITNFVILINFI